MSTSHKIVPAYAFDCIPGRKNGTATPVVASGMTSGVIYDSRNRNRRGRVEARLRTGADVTRITTATHVSLVERRKKSSPTSWDLRGTAHFPDISVSGLGAYRMLKGKPVASKALTVRITDGAAVLKAGTAAIATEL